MTIHNIMNSNNDNIEEITTISNGCMKDLIFSHQTPDIMQKRYMKKEQKSKSALFSIMSKSYL